MVPFIKRGCESRWVKVEHAVQKTLAALGSDIGQLSLGQFRVSSFGTAYIRAHHFLYCVGMPKEALTLLGVNVPHSAFIRFSDHRTQRDPFPWRDVYVGKGFGSHHMTDVQSFIAEIKALQLKLALIKG